MRVVLDPDPETYGNPYLRLYANSLAAAGCHVGGVQSRPKWGHVDVLNIHFPDLAAASQSLIRSLVWVARLHVRVEQARRHGVPVVWTAHNLRSHDQRHPRLERWSLRRFSRRIDAFAVLASPQAVLFEEMYPALRALPRAVTPHGHFREHYGPPLSRFDGRTRLGIPQEALVLLALGDLRPYKGTVALAGSFSLAVGPRLRLIIAGRDRDSATRKALEAATAADPRIELRTGWLAEDAVRDYVAACDVVCVPYASVLNSSVALLALSLGRRVLMPNVASAHSLRDEAGSRWVTVGSGAALSSRDLVECIRDLPSPGEVPDLPLRDWNQIGSSTAAFFRSLTCR